MRAPGPNPKSRNITIRTKDNWLISQDSNSYNGSTSPRINGKLKLRMNPYNRTRNLKNFSVAMSGNTAWTGEAQWNYVRINDSEALSQRQIDNCIIDFYNEVGGMATNLLDAVRQRQQAIDMVTSNLMKLYRSMKLLKKGKWKHACSALGVSPKGAPRGRDVPARWLELQYGWLPLLGDIYLLGNEFFPQPKFRAKKSVYQTLDKSFKNSRGNSNLHLEDRFSIIGYFQIDGTVLPTMQHLGVLNPLGVLWESVPFSFVVDWFLPVGDWISALTALNGVSFKEVSVVRAKVAERYGRVYFDPLKPAYASSKCDEYSYSYQRTLGLPSRPFPSFKNPLSVGHFANGMSLLATIFGKKK